MRRPLCLVCLIFVIIIIGIVEFFPYKYDFPEEINGKVVLIEGKVSQKEIKNKDGQISYYIYLEPIMSHSVSYAEHFSDNDFNLQKLNMAEGILCYMEQGSYIPNIGSRVQIYGEVSLFEKPDNPGEFDAPLYYKIKGVDFRLYDCRLEKYSNTYDVLKEQLFQIKVWLCKVIDTCFRKEYSGIAKAILLGMSGELEEDTKVLYQRNGMLHILCVSGLHISILGMGLFEFLKRVHVPEKAGSLLCVLSMLLYGTMIGMGTSVLRAILMFTMRLAAKLLGRTYDLLTASCVVIFLILLEQPLYVYHSGFLLSFLSVIALGAFRSLFPEKICKYDFLNKRADGFFSSLTVWIVTLPVYGRYYYETSVAGVLLNVLILPFVSIVLVLVIGVCILGGVYLPLGIGVAKICELFLWCFEAVFEGIDSIMHTTLIVGYTPLYKCFLFYMGLTYLVFGGEKIKKYCVYFFMTLLCTFMLIQFPKSLTITNLSVGQGDSAVIEYGYSVCIIDAGSSSEKEVSKYTILPFLKYRGIREVDYLFLTHADSDHINGVIELLSQSRHGIKIKRIVVTDGRFREEYGEIFELAKTLGIPIYEMQQGDIVKLGKASIQCLSPDEELVDKQAESNNETSMVLYLQKEDFSMLFTGDIQGEGELDVMEKFRDMGILNVTVLKVSHHGSKNSTTEEFLFVTHPRVGIISCGKNNFYGHPHKETLERLDKAKCQVLITKDHGAITIRVGRTIEVRGYSN